MVRQPIFDRFLMGARTTSAGLLLVSFSSALIDSHRPVFRKQLNHVIHAHFCLQLAIVKNTMGQHAD
ncbi:hypothetical protein WN944_013738 [Citrus x changshan-huyou]|uniref:Uncharacterized protein n=1 Tax=Citrus x changshan-huyou TaxID=2935761 RepID=A0AAP0M754_9ROSI